MLDPLQRMQHVDQFDAKIPAVLGEMLGLPRCAGVRAVR
jgi:hypothetical protein